jgi:hypothetical protein
MVALRWPKNVDLSWNGSPTSVSSPLWWRPTAPSRATRSATCIPPGAPRSLGNTWPRSRASLSATRVVTRRPTGPRSLWLGNRPAARSKTSWPSPAPARTSAARCTGRPTTTASFVRAMTNEPVPNHLKRWWFALGGTPAYLFVVQIVTGILLAFYYEPSPRRPPTSRSATSPKRRPSAGTPQRPQVGRDADDRRGGPPPDAGLLHGRVPEAARDQLDGGHVPPAHCTLVTGFTGYSLVYEQLSYWGATVGANIADSVPLVAASPSACSLAATPTTSARCRGSSCSTRPCSR